MSAKQYLKMADVFSSGSVTTRTTISANIRYGTVLILHGDQAEYAAHAISSHDELVAENERLRTALECATNHFPGAAKMVAHEGWQLVPVEPTPEMRLAGVAAQAEKLKRYALGGSLPPIDHGIPDAYRAMLAAAPKHEGGAS